MITKYYKNISILIIMLFMASAISAQFQFEYTGPDTLFVNNNCEATLEWGHPNTPTVVSTIGANIDSFYIFNISDDYEMGDIVNAQATITITYRALDDQGNADFFSFTIDIVDTIPPTVINPPIDESNTCETLEDSITARLHRWYNNHGNMNIIDNCGDMIYYADKTLQETETEFNQSINDYCGNTRSVEVYFSAEDQFGNKIQDTFAAKFFTIDESKPFVTHDPSPLDITCDGDADLILEQWLDNKGGSRVTDNCTDSANIVWHFLWNDNLGTTDYELVGDKPYNLVVKRECEYSVDINFIAEDECGNKHAAFFTTFNSHDESGPQFSILPQDTTIDCSADIPYPLVTAYDDCKGDLDVLYSEVSNKGTNSDSCNYYNYSIVQTWETDDGCVDFIQHSRTITVIDTTAPNFIVPPDTTVGCTEVDDLGVTGSPQEMTDNCFDNFVPTYSDEVIGAGCTYHIYRTWTLKDACNNTKSKTQDITVVDGIFPVVEHEPSNITLSCDDNVLFEDVFNQWVAERGGAQVSDNCNKVYSVAWLPGTYTPGDESTYPGDQVIFDIPDTLACSNDTLLYYKDVDFVFYDRCFNTLNFTRRFAIVDVVEPQLQSCPEDLVLNLELDECEKTISLEMPVVTDNCADKDLEFTKHISKQIKSDIQGSLTAPVNTVVLEIGPFNPNETDIVDILDFSLFFSHLDADDPKEFFIIYGENGVPLDTTPNTENQCEDIEIQIKDLIPLSQFQSWITDGYLTLTLEPNITQGIGELAINDICGGSSVSVDLTYTRENPNKLQYYIKIDDGEYNFVGNGENINFAFEAGNHTVDYKVLDCGQNPVFCTQTINIVDMQNPVITCPENISVQLPTDSCNLLLPLPLDFEYSDNCNSSFNYQKILPDNSAEALLNFSFNSGLGLYVANSKSFSFDNISTQKLLLNPELIIKITGDVDENDEYFEILSEEGLVIGNTSNENTNTTPGNCTTAAITTIKLDSALVNKWATDGIISFTARPHTGSNSINPCEASNVNSDGDNDGVSNLFMTLQFEELSLSYYITGETEITNTEFSDNNVPHYINFQGGLSKVNYVLSDKSNNKDTCSFDVEIQDTQAPKAICEDYYVLFVNANGIDQTQIEPLDIGGQSYDNCEIESMVVVPNSFDCSDSGTNADIRLYVWDNAGLVDSCDMNIKIDVQVLNPTFEAGVCINDSLKLFANLPDAPDNTWTIDWTGPKSFSSNLENPIRPTADATYSGTYTVTVTGLNGCQTSGSVEVVIEDLSQPQMNINKPSICSGENVILETNSYSSSVIYSWYEGSYPSGVFIDSTTVPNLKLKPIAGDHYYYVIVKSANCTSLASLSAFVEVLQQPIAEVEETFVSLCEGETFQLQTNSIASSYYWWGPNGFESNSPNPPVKENISPVDQGTYYLVVSNNVCTDTTKVELVVFDRPMTPTIESDTVFCEGGSMILTVNNITNADNYIWFQDGNLIRSQISNSLIISNTPLDYSGEWTVIAKSGNCYSDTSNAITIEIEEQYNIVATNNGPICEGDTILISAPPILNAEYHWTGPDGFESNNQNLKFKASKSGEYHLEVTTQASCVYNSTTYVEVKTRPKITALSNNAPLCLDGNDCVKFVPSVFPNGIDYTFEWSGPNGFTSNDSIAQICDFDTSNNGIYHLIISDGFCYSNITTTEIEANKNPATPILEAENTICEGDKIELIIKNNDYNDDVIFHWVTPIKEYQNKQPIFTISPANQGDSGSFSVYVENNGCISESSEEIDINIIPRPNQPFISGPATVCEGDKIELELVTSYSVYAEYHWTGPQGYESNLKNPTIYNSTLNHTGVYRVSVTIDGCESILSDGVTVEVIKTPEIPQLNPIDQVYCISENDASIDLCLNSIEANTNYSWYLNGFPTKLLGETNDLCLKITDFNEFKDGVNSVFVIASKNGCESKDSKVLSFSIDIAPDRIAFAGDPSYICNPDEAFLEAIPDPEGHWIKLNPETYIDNPNKAKTKVFDVENGENLFVWSLSHGVCENYANDTTSIYLEYVPVINDDNYKTPYNTDIDFNPLENDIDTENTIVKLKGKGNLHGELLENNDGTYTYIPNPDFIGIIELEYTVTKKDCEDNFDNGIITINVGDAGDCFGTNVITPNGDGYNDYLTFPCLETGVYKNNELLVFNQWGDQVFRAVDYKNDWQGTYNGKDLPVGTYYYLMYPDSSEKKVIKGFLVIER